MGPLLYCWGGADPTSSDQARSLAPRLPAKRLVAQTDRLPPIPTGKSAPSVPFWGRRRRRLASGANSRARRWPIGDLDAPSKPSEFLRCRDPERHFRTRAAFGVRPLAGAVEERHAALPLAQLVALGRHTVTGRLTPPKTASTATGPPTTGSTSATGPTRKPCWRRRGKRWRRNWRRTHRWWWAWTIRSCPRLAAGSPGRRGGAIPRGRLSKCRCAGRSGCCSFPPPCRWAGRGRPA